MQWKERRRGDFAGLKLYDYARRGVDVAIRARHWLWGVLVAAMLTSGLLAVPAVASSQNSAKPRFAKLRAAATSHRHRPPRAMLKSYMAHYAVSEPVAVNRLELQARAGDIVGQMGHKLGSHFGNVWFDNATGRYEVGVVGGVAQASSARPYLESQGIVGQTGFVPVRSSASELETAKERLDTKLANLFTQSAVTTGIDAEQNAVVIHVASDLSESQIAAIQADANGESVNVKVVPEAPAKLEAHSAACQNYHAWGAQELFCDKSLRGGVTLFDENVLCSLGFIVTNSTGEYVMTAGHCFLNQGNDVWYSAFSNFSPEKTSTWGYLSNNVGHYVGENGDYGFIQINTALSKWFPVSDPSSVASLDPTGPFGENESQFIENITWSAQGDTNCHTGGSSDTQCGQVLATDETIDISGLGPVGKLTRDSFCAIEGDSGGTVWGNHSGMGMVEAITAPCSEPGAESWYTEAIRDAYYMGLSFYVPPYGETY